MTTNLISEQSQIERECEDKCGRRDCHNSFAMTHADKETVEDYLTFIVNVPDEVGRRTLLGRYKPHFSRPVVQPSLEVTVFPALTLTQFLMHLSEIIGIWFGISAISFNPVDYVLKACKARRSNVAVNDVSAAAAAAERAATSSSTRQRSRSGRRKMKSSVKQQTSGSVACQESDPCEYCASTRRSLSSAFRQELLMLIDVLIAKHSKRNQT